MVSLGSKLRCSWIFNGHVPRKSRRSQENPRRSHLRSKGKALIAYLSFYSHFTRNPGGLQEAREAPRRPPGAPRSPQELPGGLQELPGGSQGGSQEPPGASRVALAQPRGASRRSRGSAPGQESGPPTEAARAPQGAMNSNLRIQLQVAIRRRGSAEGQRKSERGNTIKSGIFEHL